MLKESKKPNRRMWSDRPSKEVNKEIMATTIPMVEQTAPVPAIHFITYDEVQNAHKYAMPPSEENYNFGIENKVLENFSSYVPFGNVCDQIQYNAIHSSMNATDKNFISNTKMTTGQYGDLMHAVTNFNDDSVIATIELLLNAISYRVFRMFTERANINCDLSNLLSQFHNKESRRFGMFEQRILTVFYNHSKAKMNEDYNENFFNNNITEYWITLLNTHVSSMLTEWYSCVSNYALQLAYSNSFTEDEVIEKMNIFNDLSMKLMNYAHDTILNATIGYFEFGYFATPRLTTHDEYFCDGCTDF